jgi:hypothetical protein
MSENTKNDNETVATATTVVPDITPYYAAQIVNLRLAEAEIDKVVTPQMLYTYAKKGLIDSNHKTRTDGEKIVLNGMAFKNWLNRYVERALNGETVGSFDAEKAAELYK